MKVCKCGFKAFSFIYKLIGHTDCYFNDACAVHDELYEKAEVSRKEADKVFLNKMLFKAGKSKGRIAQAKLYYRLVRMFGSLSYGKDSVLDK